MEAEKTTGEGGSGGSSGGGSAGCGSGGDSVSTSGGVSGCVSGGKLPGDTASTLKELKKLQLHLVTLMQNEYYCDDVEPPHEAFGWSDQQLRDYFENGGT